MDFGSARVSVEEFSFPGLTECTRDVLYQTVPNVFGVPSPPGPAVGGGASLTVRNLDFCTTNYSFLLTPLSIHNVNGTAVSTDVISGDRQGEYTVREKIPDWRKGIGYQVAPLLYTVREKIPDWRKGIGYQVAPLLCDLRRLA